MYKRVIRLNIRRKGWISVFAASRKTYFPLHAVLPVLKIGVSSLRKMPVGATHRTRNCRVAMPCSVRTRTKYRPSAISDTSTSVDVAFRPAR